MLRIAALNDSVSSEKSQPLREATKEAKEAEAFTLYHHALELLRHGNTDQAEDVFRDLIDHDFLVEAWDLLEEKGSEAIHPGLQLLYSIQKNLAAMATKRKDYRAALESYLEAVRIDSTEVTVWYKTGLTALAVEDFLLAMRSFQQGLECNPRHWPCLDKIMPLLYALNNYIECLYYIGRALEMEPQYTKAYALRDRIFSIEPTLKQDTEEFFSDCDPEVHTTCISPEEAKQYVDEALEIRRHNQEICRPQETEHLHFPKTIKEYSWNHVGQVLIDLYDKATKSEKYISVALRVDVPKDIAVESTSNVADVGNHVEKDSMEIDRFDHGTEECKMEMEDIADKTANENIVSKVSTQTDQVKSVADEVNGSEDNRNALKTEKSLSEEDHTQNYCKKEPLAADMGSEKKNTYEEMSSINKANSVVEPRIECSACPKQRTENSSQSNQSGPFEKPGDSMETDEVSQESNSEVLEALRNTHSLLDSLSPVKQTVNRQVYQKTENDTSCPKVQDSMPSIPKSRSYGFNVDDLRDSKADGHRSPSQFSSNRSPCMTCPLENDITPTDHRSLSVPLAIQDDQISPIIIDSPFTNSQKTSSSASGSSASSVSTSSTSTSGCTASLGSNSTTSSASLKTDPYLPGHSETSPIVLDTTESGTLLSQEMDDSCISETADLKEVSGNQSVAGVSVCRTVSSHACSVISSIAFATPHTVSLSDSVGLTSTSISSQPESNTTTSAGADFSDVLIPSHPNTGSSEQPNTGTSSNTLTTSSDSVFSLTQLFSTASTNTLTAEAGKSTTASPARSDHGYSRSYADMQRSQRGQGQMSEKSVVLASQSGSTLIEVPIDVDDRNAKRGQKRKRMSLATEEIMMYGKRRSARVRNTGRKKEEETVNFFDLLHAFLPASIRSAADDESVTMETDQVESALEENKLADSASKATNTNTVEAGEEWREAELVKAYLEGSQINSGLIGLMNEYLHQLAKHYRVKWPVGLCAMYLEVYSRVRKHTYIPRVYDNSDPPELFQEVAQVCMLRLELQLDQLLAQMSTGSLITSPKGLSLQTLSLEDMPPFFNDDHWFVSALCDFDDTLEPIFPQHCVRVYWFKARYYFLSGRMEEAVNCYEKTKEQLIHWKEEKQLLKVTLPNCLIDSCVDIETVSSQLEQLNKSQSVEETHRLYQVGDYPKVVDILLPTFSADRQKMLKLLSDPEERQSQILMLLESLWKIGNFEKCLLWSEESFSECYAQYQQSVQTEQRSVWMKTIIVIFEYMLRVLEKGTTLVKSLPPAKVVRFSQHLIRLIDMNMSLPETVAEMSFDSVLPWILLYYIIKQEEDQSMEQKIVNSGAINQDEEALSSSHMLLNIAHDYLGSRCWCTHSDGALLKFFMRVLSTKMDHEAGKSSGESSRLLEDCQQSFEQCVYCLYGHPNKKGKAKHLQDHNVLNIDLDWDHAVKIFRYFKPQSLPEFDGYRTDTISAELESLLKRIIMLIPDECKRMGVTQDEIQSYVKGTANSIPVTIETRQVTLPIVTEIYYLLADYYLKSKEAVKAIKFYMQDLCMVPDRLDSWAGMALARMSQLEVKLRSAELKMDVPIYKKSVAALRCFKRAVEIDSSNHKLWIEYGTLAYQLHSHASRQIKWKKWFNMAEEFVSIAKESCHEMLLTATECFRMAGRCERDSTEDDWLYNYMIGKCMEKAGKPLGDYLPYYFKALECVHEEKATYPKKIVFTFTASHLAVEALEMYYRIHVTILKVLLRKPADAPDHMYKMYAQHLLSAEAVPFVHRIEKGQESRGGRESASSADESSCSEFTSPTKPKLSSADHTYFRQKSSSHETSAGPTVIEVTEGSVETYSKAGTTFELYAEEQSSKSVENLTLTTEPGAPPLKSFTGEEMADKTEKMTSENYKTAIEIGKDTEISGIKKQPFSIASILCGKDDDKGQGDGHYMKCESPKAQVISKADENVAEPMEVGEASAAVTEKKAESQSLDMQQEVKSVLLHIEDLIEAELSNYDSSEKKLPVADGMKQTEIPTILQVSNPEETAVSLTSAARFEDQINSLLRLPVRELHQALIEKCRHALELCMRRFPTHYKSHYRLAYLYFHSPYQTDLEKAHNILLGNPNWKNYSYMPCAGLFGERKPAKFFQCIWKIPIDEIDRSGSFPAHLNRCIELLLHILREEHDSRTLHEVHLQLNRQPEPGRKYLRDAEKRCYALKSHRYTLDAVELQIEDMKLETNSDVRHQFLKDVYKIWEHGVQKLNKYPERIKKLFSEAYRVVLRKYETLPQNMLLDQAIRYCKQLQQKAKLDKASTSFTSPVANTSTPISLAKVLSPAPVGLLPGNQSTIISLQSLMSAQIPVGSLLKSSVNAMAVSADIRDLAKKIESEKKVIDNSMAEVIVLSDSSVSSPMRPMSDKPIMIDSPRESQFAKESPMSQKSSCTTPGSNAPTVKIKMGLLQAAKRFKPSGSLVGSGDNDTSQDESALDISDSEPLFPTKMVDTEEGDFSSSSSSESGTSSSSSSSSSESTSDDSDDDDNDSDNNDDGGGESTAVGEENDDGESSDSDNEEDDESGSRSEDEDGDDNDENSDNDDDGNNSSKKEVVNKKPPPPKLKMKLKPASEDEEESSDDMEEIDLSSSSEDDDKNDKDYNASEDEADDEDDIILISDDEIPRGRVVIPSPTHKMFNEMEILVKDVPGFDPIISSIMSNPTGD
ncbi:calcineurin-binding protein cabin-1-like isoform X2 [Dreissena polymorpha]|uniref:calcineurin-binding protein cabin-1-like isoform X2 n=1 Tax=Dreissena polymorpha TaxID=45954 RepID=UPI0022644AB0|nr:calcineurin-binding protein cabin-1-like isoform X2 [Dreissena polymorpha]